MAGTQTSRPLKIRKLGRQLMQLQVPVGQSGTKPARVMMTMLHLANLGYLTHLLPSVWIQTLR